MKRLFATMLVCVLTAGPLITIAAEPTEDTFKNQKVDVVISPDWSVKARWTLPAFTAETDIYTLPEYKNFGFSGAFSYTLVGASNENGPITFSHEPEDFAYVNSGYKSGRFIRNLYLDYDFKPPFRAPFILYEFPIFSGAFFRSPKLSVSYPSNLKFISSWPPPEKTSPVEITYPTSTVYAPQAVLLFMPDPLPNGTVLQKEGRFTIAGDKESVRRVAEAAKGLGELDSVVQELLDTSLPSDIYVMIADLDPVHLSFEASGLAIPPNTMLLNRSLIATHTDIDLKLLLSHESTHLVEMGKSLFKGAVFDASWFAEGIATAVELEMRDRLLTTHTARMSYDLTGSYSGHLFSVPELKNKYAKPFDFDLSGTAYYPTYTSYAHGALVLRRLYHEKGRNGMRQLYARLKDAEWNEICNNCDSDPIVGTIGKIVGTNVPDGVLFPFNGDAHFAEKVAGLTQEKREEGEEDAVIISYIKEQIPQYFTETGVNLKPVNLPPATLTDISKPAVVPATTTAVSTPKPSLPQKPTSDIQRILDTSKKDIPIVTKPKTRTPAVQTQTKQTIATSTIAKPAPVVTKPIEPKKKPGIIQKMKGWFKK
ncbi:MAG: hypothetical protein EXS51_01535 [Candidatus Taylorbacteria bacterium]|nr:hypothetical protein [Candidatus Taylorbacteria bacterium]